MPAEASGKGDKSMMTSIIVHNSGGLQFQDGPPKFGGNSSKFETLEGKLRFLIASPNGKRLAWITNGEVFVAESPDWKRIGKLQHPKAVELCFSPNGNYLAVWDMFTPMKGVPPPENLSIYDVNEKRLMKSFHQKNHDAWQPQWTKDEAVMARMITSEVHLYEGKELESYKCKKVFPKLRSYSLSPSIGHHYLTFFVPSLKAAPAFVHLYKYPNVQDNSSVVANKSFFKVDGVEFFWNVQSSAVLVLTTAEMDRSGTSYYGDQGLYFLSTRGQSNRVTFSKEGNVRSVCWCPSGKEFFCVYGYAPARVTIFNLKCDPVIEFGEGARNIVMVNPQGNLALIGAMGNISSRFEIWDISQKKQLATQECPDSTHMEWAPCGQHIVTSTCSPRLRVNNGFKVWHYSATLLHENLCAESEELYSARFLPDSSVAKPFDITMARVKGIESQVTKASSQRYIPPSQRAAASMIDRTKKFLSERENPPEEKAPEDLEKEKKKQKRKAKFEEAKKKKEVKKGMDKDWREKKEEPEDKVEEKKPAKKENTAKRIKNIKRKLESIEKLKGDKEEGKFLHPTQLLKIESEQALVKELEGLSVTVPVVEELEELSVT